MDRRHGNGEHEKRCALVVRIGEFRTKRQLCDCPGDTRVAQSLTALHQAAGSSMEGMESAYSGAPPLQWRSLWMPIRLAATRGSMSIP